MNIRCSDGPFLAVLLILPLLFHSTKSNDIELLQDYNHGRMNRLCGAISVILKQMIACVPFAARLLLKTSPWKYIGVANAEHP